VGWQTIPSPSPQPFPLGRGRANQHPWIDEVQSFSACARLRGFRLLRRVRVGASSDVMAQPEKRVLKSFIRLAAQHRRHDTLDLAFETELTERMGERLGSGRGFSGPRALCGS